MNKTLIPTYGTRHAHSNLDSSQVVCVVFDARTLDIINIAQTHNEAEQLSVEYFNKGIDARADAIRYSHESITPRNLVGMKMNRFTHFLESNNHPLNNLDLHTETDQDTVDTMFENSYGDCLQDYANRGLTLDKSLDFALVDNGTFIGGVACEMSQYDDHYEIDLGYFHVEPPFRGQGAGRQIADLLVDRILPNITDTNKELKLFAEFVSPAGKAVAHRVTTTLQEKLPAANVRLIEEEIYSPTPM